jgi:hypothetical protein
MLTWRRADDAARQAKQHHVRNISSEMQRVVRKPISNSISNSSKNGVAGWCPTGLLTAKEN